VSWRIRCRGLYLTTRRSIASVCLAADNLNTSVTSHRAEENRAVMTGILVSPPTLVGSLGRSISASAADDSAALLDQVSGCVSGRTRLNRVQSCTGTGSCLCFNASGNSGTHSSMNVPRRVGYGVRAFFPILVRSQWRRNELATTLVHTLLTLSGESR